MPAAISDSPTFTAKLSATLLPERAGWPERSLFHELEVIDVADGAGLPSGGHHHFHHLPASDQLHALMRERFQVFPAARVWNSDRPGPVHCVELEVKCAARPFAG